MKDIPGRPNVFILEQPEQLYVKLSITTSNLLTGTLYYRVATGIDIGQVSEKMVAGVIVTRFSKINHMGARPKSEITPA